MRKITFGGANSLDNFFARSDHSVDWLMWSDEAAEIIQDFWENIDTMLMGRRTFEVVQKQNSGGESQEDSGIETFVFSRTLNAEDVKGATVVSKNAEDFVRDLKDRNGKDICLLGGGNFAKTLFEADLIDEIGFNIHPVLLGSGIPLFYNMKKQINLELIECKPFKNGCVYVLYRVKN